jgi:threonine/homoserine/homoserine lactone efflux protein
VKACVAGPFGLGGDGLAESVGFSGDASLEEWVVMDFEIALVARGFVLGFAIAAQVGPIGVLVIRRSLTDGMLAGLCTGMGAAVADASYAAIAAWGITAGAGSVTSSLLFRSLAAALLAWMGVRILRADPPVIALEPPRAASYGRAFASTVALTLANPATIASFAAASTALGVGTAAHPRALLGFAGSVLAGSAGWWLALSAILGAFRTRLGPSALRGVQLVAGATLLGFAVLALR